MCYKHNMCKGDVILPTVGVRIALWVKILNYNMYMNSAASKGSLILFSCKIFFFFFFFFFLHLVEVIAKWAISFRREW